MAFLTVPARNDLPWYQFSIVLSGVVYTLTFRYNGRMSRWMMNITDSSGTDLLNGIPCLIGVSMTGRFVELGLPDGDFFCIDDTNQDTQPTRDSFGIDHTLLYSDPTQ